MGTVPGRTDPRDRDAFRPPRVGHEPIRVLLIDDDREDYLLTKDLVLELGGRYTLDWIAGYEEGLEAICVGSHDIVLLDYRLGARSGIELLREAQAKRCEGPVILLTGQGQSRTDLEALDAGADDYLEKSGLTAAFLERSMRYALAQRLAESSLERKVIERTEELAKANEALREADRRKDEFLSTLGHELRNPLAPILNALEIIRLCGDNAEAVAQQRERLERQVKQMVRLVDDLLDVSRVSTGKLRLTEEPITLQEVCEAAIDISRSLIEKSGVQLKVALPTEPVSLQGDRVRLTQVFSNLLNNAAKYTEAGGRVTLTGHADGDRAIVKVRDTGVGIAPEVLPRIFELFTQVDRSLNRSQGGLGVGLALVRRFVELHGGSVTARSEGLGQGAEFTVELPLSGQTSRVD